MGFIQLVSSGTVSLPAVLAVLFAISLAISAVGFIRVVYFVSIGYAFSISAMGIVAPIFYWETLSWASGLHNVLLVVWGLRLGIYLVRRESHASYRLRTAEEYTGAAKTGLPKRVLIWLGVSALYVLMFSSSLFSLASGSLVESRGALFGQLPGLGVMLLGLVLETIADRQKSALKAQHPGEFCGTGLYGWVRYPNYLGEILVWVGSWVMGLMFYTSPLMWVMSTVGLICIILIMMGSTKRLESSQGERYGDQPAYQTYVRTVPVLFPGIPVYTLRNIRVYLE
jgi:steroid 5-alpha reductase family enzyme